MVELNNEIRNFFSTVVAFLFLINLTLAISTIGELEIFVTILLFSICPSIILFFAYLSKDPRNPRNKPNDQDN